MSRRNPPPYLAFGWQIALAVAAFSLTACSDDPGGDSPGVEPDATGAPDAGPDLTPDAVEDMPDAVAMAPDAEVPADAAPDARMPSVDDLTAIVALSNCSGAVIRLKNSRPTDHALVLTNGHCIGGGFLGPGEVVVGRQTRRRMRVLEPEALIPGPPTRLPPPTGVRVEVETSELIYATMTSTDMAVYRLTITYAELERDHDVHAMVLSDRRPETGTAILIPSGYWHALFSCSISGFVHALREGEWTFDDSMRFGPDGCETIGGTSGSPIVATATHEVIGVNNTANEGGVSCSMNNPCEVDMDGNTTSVDEGRYGQQTYLLYGCLSPTNELDFDLPGCRLPRPTL